MAAIDALQKKIEHLSKIVQREEGFASMAEERRIRYFLRVAESDLIRLQDKVAKAEE